MLTLTRSIGESIKIFSPAIYAEDGKMLSHVKLIEILIKDIVKRDNCSKWNAKIGITAPRDFAILRSEIYVPGQEFLKVNNG